MSAENNPQHGVTLKKIIETLAKEYTWEELDEHVQINCFYKNPSIKSSLNFLRKTPWARERVEKLYYQTINKNK